MAAAWAMFSGKLYDLQLSQARGLAELFFLFRASARRAFLAVFFIPLHKPSAVGPH